MKIAVIDYGLANLRSVINAMECLGVEPYLAEKGDQLAEADKIILPGVGSFDGGMQGLRTRGHSEALNHYVYKHHVPCLGICLGLQFFFEGSEEGKESGLGWFTGTVRYFDNQTVKVPHIGWNEIVTRPNTNMFADLDERLDVYFVHSYYVPYENDAALYCSGYCEYGQKYVAALEKGHIFGVQFHPEKSQLAGMKILENFIQ